MCLARRPVLMHPKLPYTNRFAPPNQGLAFISTMLVPVEGKMVLVMVDGHSKWIEAVPTATATSTAVIEVCRERFSQFGLPET